MITWGVVAIAFIIAGGTSAINGDAQSKVKTVEDYWAETGLTLADLHEYVANDKCHGSEQKFLACINAVGAMAEKLGLGLTEKGLLLGNVEAKGRTTEKQFLSRYSWLFLGGQDTEIDFDKVLEQISAEQKTKLSNEANLAAIGLNSFISVNEDPHTYLVPANYYQNVISKSDQKTVALGMVLGPKATAIYVLKVYDGSAAADLGLQVGDQLLSVNGHSLINKSWTAANELLRGEEGQKISLEVRRGNANIVVSTTRQTREIPTVTSRVLAGSKPVGLISVNKFSTGVCRRVASALQNINQQDVRALLLDLRDNSGGQVEEASCLVGLFVGPKDKVFSLRYFDDSNEDIYGTEEAKLTDLPMAVLVNSGSASASEIVAGALRDFKRAILVGERTFGKGTFQEGKTWNRNPKIAKFFTKGFYELPSGVSTQLAGLEPDVKVSSSYRDSLREEDLYWNPKKLQNREASLEMDKQIMNAKSFVLQPEAFEKGN